jgi:hypothetical protein
VHRTAADVIDTVSACYSTWRADIVRAEIERRARAGGVPLADIDAVVEATLVTALAPALSVRLGKPDEIDEPAALRRRDGTTVFTVAAPNCSPQQRSLMQKLACSRRPASRTGGPSTPGPSSLPCLRPAPAAPA